MLTRLLHKLICNLFLLLLGGWCILSISPCQSLHAVWYHFDCPNIVCLIAFPNQSNSQAELSKPNRDFKISKRKRTRSLSEYISICQYSLQGDVCIPNHLVTRSVTKGRASPPRKNFLPPCKMSWTYCMHNHCFRICYQCKTWASLRQFFSPPGVQSWIRVCWVTVALCQLCHSAQSFHNQIFQV